MDQIKSQCDIKCLCHITQDILIICLTCKFKPICIKCITSNEHRGHEFIDFEDEKVIDIINSYQKEIIPILLVHLDLVESSLKRSETKFNEIEKSHNKNLQVLVKQFLRFKKKQIKFEKNIKGIIIEDIKKNLEKRSNLQLISNDNNNCLLHYLDNINKDDLIQSIKQNYEIKYLLPLSVFSQEDVFSWSYFKFNEKEFESIKESLKDYIRISKRI
ncbi:hypothetical protein ACTFIV_007672 [Dictyostelium citrinum]